MNSFSIRRWALLIASSTLSSAGCTNDGDPTGGEEAVGEASQAVKTIVNNGGFETGDVAGFRVRGVTTGSTSAPYGSVGRLRGATGWVAQDVTSKLTPGASYTFQASVRQAGSTADQANSPRLRVDNCDPNGTEYVGMSAGVPFAATWQTLTAQLAYTGQGPVCVRVTANGYQGDTFVDNVSVSGGVTLAHPAFSTGTLAGWQVPNVRAVSGAGLSYGGAYAAEAKGVLGTDGKVNGPGGSGFPFISQDVKSRLVSNVAYTLSAKVKVTTPGQYPPRLRVGTNCELSSDYAEVKALNQTNPAGSEDGWQTLSWTSGTATLNLSQSVCVGVIDVSTTTAGTFLVDDFKVTAAEVCSTAWDDDGDGVINNGCTCTPGEANACYEGFWLTEDVGSCHGGTMTCNPDGMSFGPCTGEVLPSTEVCGNQADENCDDVLDDGCLCQPGAIHACSYSGPPGTENVGLCHAGNKSCSPDGMSFGPCTGEVLPSTEVCGNQDDENCDNVLDDGSCVGTPVGCSGAADGTPCDDGNACTQTDTCQAGTCAGANPVVCAAPDQCHTAGTCNPATGTCTNPNAADGTTCDDGNACTKTDTCQAGTCTGANPVVCAALDQCHTAGTCNTATGTCSNPNAANSTPCNDGNACTVGDTCQNGTCASGASTPAEAPCNGIDDNCNGTVDEGYVCAGSCIVSSYGGHTYQFCPGPLNNTGWLFARNDCLSKGMDLVTITSAAENSWVHSMAYNLLHNFAWIGLNDKAAEGSYQWANGEPVSYTNWYLNEPTGSSNIFFSDEDCAVIQSYYGHISGWQDTICGYGYNAWICESP